MERSRIRTQPFTYAIFGVLIGPIFVIWLFLAWRNPASTDWQGAIAAGALLAAVWLWFASLQVELYPDRLVLRTLFGKREIRYADIRRVEVIARHYRGATGRAWAIYDGGRFAAHPLKIPMGPFSVSDQHKIAETLLARATAAQVDARARSLGREAAQ